jgi:hypothetical protein
VVAVPNPLSYLFQKERVFELMNMRLVVGTYHHGWRSPYMKKQTTIICWIGKSFKIRAKISYMSRCLSGPCHR